MTFFQEIKNTDFIDLKVSKTRSRIMLFLSNVWCIIGKNQDLLKNKKQVGY